MGVRRNKEKKSRGADLPPPAALPLMLVGQHSPCAWLTPNGHISHLMQLVDRHILHRHTSPVVCCIGSCLSHVVLILTGSMLDTSGAHADRKMLDTNTSCRVGENMCCKQFSVVVQSQAAMLRSRKFSLIKDFVAMPLHDLCRTQTSAANVLQQLGKSVVSRPLGMADMHGLEDMEVIGSDASDDLAQQEQ